MTDIKLHADNATTTLNGAINDSTTTVVVDDGSVFPSPTGSEFFAVTVVNGSDMEIMHCSSRSTNTLTVSRGEEGTSGTAFADGSVIEIRVTADDVDRKERLVKDQTLSEITSPDSTDQILMRDVTDSNNLKYVPYSSFSGGLSAIVDDTTPQLGGELELNGNYIDFGGSSTSTTYCMVSNAGVPRIYGAANIYFAAGASSLLWNAGSTFHQMEFENGSNRFTIKTNNSNRFRVNDSGVAIFNGDLDLNTNNIIDTGNIQANQISFDAGTNYLDYYEEGTFTPVFAFATAGDLSNSYSVQSGSYTRIGNVVFGEVKLEFTPTFTTASGQARITGLPFTASGGNVAGVFYETNSNVAWGGGTMIIPTVANGTSRVILGSLASASNLTNINTSHITSGVATKLRFSFYHYV